MGSVEEKVCESCQGTGKRRDPVLLREELCKCAKPIIVPFEFEGKSPYKPDIGVWCVPESSH